MTKPTKPTVPPPPSRANPGTVFSQTADTFAAFQSTFADYLDATAEFVDERADEALAAALGGDLPSLTGQAGNSIVVNQAGTAASFAPISGRNRIINGQGRINQRGYVSGAATSGANQYTLDRWRVVTSGQSLTFTGTDAGRTMTAPAGGVEQVIEGANIEGGTYVLNWTGTATATVNGTARTKGETFTLTANTNATVRFTSGTFTDVQLELGSTPTTFERLSLAQELFLCQRYYEFGESSFIGPAIALYLAVPFAVPKRTPPTLARTGDGSITSSTAGTVATNSTVFRFYLYQSNTSGCVGGNWTADAEL